LILHRVIKRLFATPDTHFRDFISLPCMARSVECVRNGGTGIDPTNPLFAVALVKAPDHRDAEFHDPYT
jgi:hypothetical protein